MAIADRPSIVPLTTPAVLVDRARQAGDLAALVRRDAAWERATDHDRQDAAHRLSFARWRCNPSGRLGARVEPRRRLVRAILTEILSVALFAVTIPLLVGWLVARRIDRWLRP